MAHSRFTKRLTLLTFVFILAAFVLYRAGKFDHYLSRELDSLHQSPNGGTIHSNTAEVKQLEQDSMKRELLRMASSKTIILTDQQKSLFDSLFAPLRDSVKVKKGARIKKSRK